MTAPVKVFHSGQTSAPTSSGEVGKMVAILDACLVDGFNTKTPTAISVASNVVTVTATSHGYNQWDVVEISGVTDKTELNSEWIITSAVTDSFTFTSSTSTDGSAAGTFSSKIAPLGWEIVFTDTNKRVYRSTNGISTGCYLRVDDTAATVAAVNRYEHMTDIDTGIYASEDIWWLKSTVVGASTRDWILIGDSLLFSILVKAYTSYQSYSNYVFGDINSIDPGDQYGCILFGHNNAAPTNIAIYTSAHSKLITTSYTGNVTGMSIMRSPTGLQRNRRIAAHSGVPSAYLAGSSGSGPQYPLGDTATNTKLYFDDVIYWQMDGDPDLVRGTFPGMKIGAHYNFGKDSFPVLDRTLTIDGRTYVNIWLYNGVAGDGYAGPVWYDITGPWGTGR
jgi:hypothetical protein